MLDGAKDGKALGIVDCTFVGVEVGCIDGIAVGTAVGTLVG